MKKAEEFVNGENTDSIKSPRQTFHKKIKSKQKISHYSKTRNSIGLFFKDMDYLIYIKMKIN